ncbi:MAG: DNA repair protein RecN [Chitinivibrionia bacterium]|nr:DNA repair protein RecN [Chitinivibrionia bacterium]
MLNYLKINNLALIKNIELELENGFCVFTGETGAGKSILMGAISLLLGSRASAETIRNGEANAEVVGSFNFDKIPESLQLILDENAISAGDKSLVIKRIIASESSKNKILINGEICSLSTLKAIGETIIDLHGQHDHQMLLNEDAPYQIIDKIKEIAAEKQKFNVSWENYCTAEKNLNAHIKKCEELQKKEDFLRFEFDAIKTLELKSGEEEEMEREFAFLSSVSQRIQTAAGISDILNGNENSSGMMTDTSNLLKLLQNIAETDKSFENWSQELKPFLQILKELEKTVGKYESSAEDADPAKLDELNERIAKIQKLKKKYACSFEELLQKKDDLQHQLEAIENGDFEKGELEKKLAATKKDLETTASILSDLRKKTCKNFDVAITNEMAKLGFNGGAFLTQFTKKEKIDQNGADEIIFTVRTNSGEQFLPLAKTASGGEISRIMLAVKTTLAESDTVPIMIFDEIDTGVGGEIASDIAKAIKKLAKDHQILVISHLHQIASQADFQYAVYKTHTDGRTETKIVKLSKEQRITEIARMLGGENETTIRHAKELLK